MSLKKKLLLPFIIILTLILCGWGQTGHNIINKNAVLSFPPQMNEFLSWSDQLALHASDADNRKSADPTEAPKHYIDIDSYPEFVSTGRISQDYDSVVTAHGESFVIGEGILPWAIITTYDTLEKCFERRDWNKAVLVAADLGHYVADSHQPLHITKNYNPGGLHSRYETGMIDRYQAQIVYSGDSVQFVQNIPDFVFSTIYSNYIYVDSVINADVKAKAVNSDTRSDAYYQALWNITGSFTVKLFKSASYKLACLIYTAWVNAGSPLISGGYLPVELVSFSAAALSNSVALNWKTATENNNMGFDIEKSSDGNVFKKISFVKGKGSTTEENLYTFTDKNVNTGTYYYRLRQIDYNGTYSYSNVVTVKIGTSPERFSLFQNYPNPFNPTTKIQYAVGSRQLVTLKVYDMTGKEVATLVNKIQTAGNYEVQFSAGSKQLASGIYFYRLKAGNYISTKKLVLLK